MKKIFLSIFLILFFSSSVNADWTKISKTIDGKIYYIDYENIRVEGKLIYFWEFMKYEAPTQDGTLSHKIYQILDCNGFLTKPLRFKFYTDKNGTSDPDSQKSLIDEWEPLPPGSVGLIAAKKLCKKI